MIDIVYTCIECIIILTTFYQMCHLLYSATGDVVKVIYYLNILETLKEILLLLWSKVDPWVLKPYHKIISTCFIVIGCPLTESRVLLLTVPTFPQCK